VVVVDDGDAQHVSMLAAAAHEGYGEQHPWLRAARLPP
jgi:hypothetical protein